MLSPLHVPSLKDACIARLEQLILSGELKAGERLPSERDLALRLDVSRPVLHEALVDLAAKGLVTIRPRRGVLVNDYRKTGSTAILSSLLSYHTGQFEPRFVDSLLAMRILLETETARLAALNATPDQLAELRALLDAEASADRAELPRLMGLDFEFHLLLAIASGNLVYPLIINSFKNVYTHFTGEFFTRSPAGVLEEVFAFHRRLVEAVAAGDPDAAAHVMAAMLQHGEKHLKGESR